MPRRRLCFTDKSSKTSNVSSRIVKSDGGKNSQSTNLPESSTPLPRRKRARYQSPTTTSSSTVLGKRSHDVNSLNASAEALRDSSSTCDVQQAPETLSTIHTDTQPDTTPLSDDENDCVSRQHLWLGGDVTLPSTLSLRAESLSFITRATSAADKASFWGTHNTALLDTYDMFLARLSKQQLFPTHEHGARFLRKFLNKADVEHLVADAPGLRSLSPEEERIFEGFRKPMSMLSILLRAPLPAPSSDNVDHLRAWFFVRTAVEHFALNHSVMQPHMRSRSEGWWDTMIWSPLLYLALGTSSCFQLNQKELVSCIDQEHHDNYDITPRQQEELGGRARRDATAPALIKYDGIVQQMGFVGGGGGSSSSSSSNCPRVDLAFIEVKSAAQFSNMHDDRNKVTRAMRRALLMIRAAVQQKLDGTTETAGNDDSDDCESSDAGADIATDAVMRDVVLGGVVCKGDAITYLRARVAMRRLVVFGEDTLRLPDICGIAECSWRLRLTLEHTHRVLAGVFDGYGRRPKQDGGLI